MGENEMLSTRTGDVSWNEVESEEKCKLKRQHDRNFKSFK